MVLKKVFNIYEIKRETGIDVAFFLVNDYYSTFADDAATHWYVEKEEIPNNESPEIIEYYKTINLISDYMIRHGAELGELVYLDEI